jgi:hypothetical protein
MHDITFHSIALCFPSLCDHFEVHVGTLFRIIFQHFFESLGSINKNLSASRPAQSGALTLQPHEYKTSLCETMHDTTVHSIALRFPSSAGVGRGPTRPPPLPNPLAFLMLEIRNLSKKATSIAQTRPVIRQPHWGHQACGRYVPVRTALLLLSFPSSP